MAEDNLLDAATTSGTTTGQTWSPTNGLLATSTLAASPAQATISEADPATATAATRALDQNELVSNNVNNLIKQDSPLMQQATTKAAEASNSRGLLNSSMAVGAAQGAVMDRAVPIAQADANATSNVLNSNQANQQQVNITNASNIQNSNQFNASESNKLTSFNASESNKVLSQMLDQQNKLQLADIEATYKTVMQSQSSAMTLYQNSVRDITDILQNPDLTPEAKQQAVASANQLLSTGLQIMGKIGGLNLDDMLNFETPGTAQGSGLTLGADSVANGKQLALAAGITAAADVNALGALTVDKQTAINTAITNRNKNALIGAIADTSLSAATKTKLLGMVA